MDELRKLWDEILKMKAKRPTAMTFSERYDMILDAEGYLYVEIGKDFEEAWEELKRFLPTIGYNPAPVRWWGQYLTSEGRVETTTRVYEELYTPENFLRYHDVVLVSAMFEPLNF